MLHPYAHAPTRDAMQAVFDGMDNPDGNFVKDFQTTGFDARVWELYLYAWGTLSGHYQVYRPHDRPDFRFSRNLRTVWIEACVAGEGPAGTLRVDPDADEAARLMHQRERHYNFVPLRIGGALFRKLKEEYWTLEWVDGLPFVLAVADFHDPFPARDTSGALASYLYGVTEEILSKEGEPLRRGLKAIPDHRKPTGATVPTGFFNQPGAENVSAVLFSNAGTAPKFSRMGYDPERHAFLKMVRYGFRANFDPNAIVPTPFAYVVGGDEDQETWGEGMEVFYNPNARIPLPPNFFPDACEHALGRDFIESQALPDHPMMSVTGKWCEPSGSAFSDPDIFERLARALQQRVEFDMADAETFVRNFMKPDGS